MIYDVIEVGFFRINDIIFTNLRNEFSKYDVIRSCILSNDAKLWYMTSYFRPFLVKNQPFKRTENICYSSLMKIIILVSDLMSLTFFFLVRDEGSWLDVGLSISNFSIVLLMNISITLVMLLSSILATKSGRNSAKMS